jgi:uncharacterized protein (TIGR03437 family)
VLALSACAAPSFGQVITSVAGGGWQAFPTTGIPALSAPLGTPWAAALDGQGNLYVADGYNNVVVRITSGGTLTLVAGNGNGGFSGDGGPATSASLNQPVGVALDSAGNLYIGDRGNHRIRKVSGGTITTVAGNGFADFSGDGGPAANASLYYPSGVALDTAGNLYIADEFNDRIRKVSGGVIETVAGNGYGKYAGDGGPATSASLYGPIGVAVDSAGNIYIGDTYNNAIRKVSAGTITTVAGNGVYGFSGDGGAATSAQLGNPLGVRVDASGNIYIADQLNQRVRVVSNGIIRTVAGNGQTGITGDGGPSTSASLFNPSDVAVDSAGDIYVTDFFNKRIRKVAGGITTTVAGDGDGTFFGNGGSATGAALLNPTGVAVDLAGDIYIADFGNNAVRKVSGGTIVTVAGTGAAGYSGDGGPASRAALNGPKGIALDSAGNLYIADQNNHRIRKVSGGTITTIAGTGSNGFFGDGGPATSAWLSYPFALTADPAGNLYIADYGNGRVRKVSGGTISTVAGNGYFTFAGDGGPATSASFNGPEGLAVDSAGNLYIADVFNNRIRKLSGGILTTFAGNGTEAFAGDGGPALSASFYEPSGVTVDAAGNVLVGDYINNRIRKISGGIVSTVAGNGFAAFFGDGGPAASASLNNPIGVAVDSAGNLYIADTYNYRIREVLNSLPLDQVSPLSLSFSGTAGGSAPGAQTVGISASVSGLLFTASTSASWLSVNTANGATPAVLQANVNPANLTTGTYTGTIAIATPGAVPPSSTVTVTLTVVSANPPSLGTDKQSVSFAATQGAAPLTQQLQVLNTGGGSFPFTATVTNSSGGSWLSVSTVSGTASATSPAAIVISATPGSLSPGTYNGAVAIAGAGGNINVPVTLSISAATAVILVSQSGLTFTAVSQGGAPLPQSFGVLNIGQGSMNWAVSAQTLSGGSNWLQLSSSSGTVTQPFLDVSLVNVSIDPTGLAPGNYSGRIQVTSAAANSPQLLTVTVNVLPAGSNPGPQIQPNGVIFTGTAGVSPGSQDVTLGNPLAQAQSYLSNSIGTTFTYLPASASVQPSQPATLRVFPDFSNVNPGQIAHGVVTLLYDDGTARTISVLTVVAPTGSTPNVVGGKIVPHASSACSSSNLEIQFRSLQANFAAIFGQATTVEVQVTDDCGNLIGPGSSTGAAVQAVSSNGDAAINLTHIGNGIWTGTWRPVHGNPGAVAVTVTAFQILSNGSQKQGQTMLSGSLTTGAATPILTARGVVQGASFAAGVPVAPGSLIAIFGSNLADSSGPAGVVPFPSQLNGVQVLMGAEALPLLYSSAGQVNVQVPFDVPVNTNFQMTVQRDSVLSIPESLVIAAAQPGIFTMNQQGTGQGAIVNLSNVLIDENAPAAIGDAVVIYCTGLGPVSPAVPAGNAAPVSPLSYTTNTVTATIGGQPAQVLFAGLAPTFAGLYQVNAIVPAGVAAGNAVPVVLQVAGQASPPVTIAVK